MRKIIHKIQGYARTCMYNISKLIFVSYDFLDFVIFFNQSSNGRRQKHAEQHTHKQKG